jgi:hypothetical protein
LSLVDAIRAVRAVDAGKRTTRSAAAVLGLAAHDARADGAISTDATNGMDAAAFTVRAMSRKLTKPNIARAM